MRPTLKLKKRPPDPVETPVIADVEPAVTVASTDPSPPEVVKDPQKEANRLLNEARRAKSIEQKRKLKPVVRKYLRQCAVLQEVVRIDGVKCLKPLACKTRERVVEAVRGFPEAEGCSTTLINRLVGEQIHRHVSRYLYLTGVLKFNTRFDLDGNEVDTITEEQKARAKELLKQHQEQYKKKSKSSETVNAPVQMDEPESQHQEKKQPT